MADFEWDAEPFTDPAFPDPVSTADTSAGLLLVHAGEHAQLMAAGLAGLRSGVWSLHRGVLENAARAAWRADPDLSVSERVRLMLNEDLYARFEQKQILERLNKAELLAEAQGYIDGILEGATRFPDWGDPVPATLSKKGRWSPPRIGEHDRWINPLLDKIVGYTNDDESLPRLGYVNYQMASATLHGSSHGLQLSGLVGGVGDEFGFPAPPTTPQDLVGAHLVAVIALFNAALIVWTRMGWDPVGLRSVGEECFRTWVDVSGRG